MWNGLLRLRKTAWPLIFMPSIRVVSSTNQIRRFLPVRPLFRVNFGKIRSFLVSLTFYFWPNCQITRLELNTVASIYYDCTTSPCGLMLINYDNFKYCLIVKKKFENLIQIVTEYYWKDKGPHRGWIPPAFNFSQKSNMTPWRIPLTSAKFLALWWKSSWQKFTLTFALMKLTHPGLSKKFLTLKSSHCCYKVIRV